MSIKELFSDSKKWYIETRKRRRSTTTTKKKSTLCGTNSSSSNDNDDIFIEGLDSFGCYLLCNCLSNLETKLELNFDLTNMTKERHVKGITEKFDEFQEEIKWKDKSINSLSGQVS